MANEEVRIKTGVDNTALRGGMVQAEDIVKGSGEKIFRSLKTIKSLNKAMFLVQVIPVGIEKLDQYLTGVQKMSSKLVSYLFTGSFSAIEEIHSRVIQNAIERLNTLRELNAARWKEEADMAKAQEKYETALEKIAMEEADEKGKVVLIAKELKHLEFERSMLLIDQKKGTSEWINLQTKIEEKFHDQKKAIEARGKAEQESIEKIEKLNKERFEKEKRYDSDKSKLNWEHQDRLKELTSSMPEEYRPTAEQIIGSGTYGRGRNKNTYTEGAGEQKLNDYNSALKDYQDDVARFGFQSKTNPGGVEQSRVEQLDKLKGDMNQFFTGKRQNVQEQILAENKKSAEALAAIETAFKEEK